MNAVVARGVHIERDDARLRDLSLVVAPGEQVALCGEDQPSLTLFVRACVGLEQLSSGTLTVLGVDVVAATREQLVALRRRIGYVSIAGGLLSNMSLQDNVAIALRYRGESTGRARAVARELLGEIGLDRFADERACTVPAELQKCTAYARALATRPELVLVEDPSAFLHPKGRASVEALHRVIAERGIASLVADDDVAFVTTIATRALLFRDGLVVHDGPAAALEAGPGRSAETWSPVGGPAVRAP